MTSEDLSERVRVLADELGDCRPLEGMRGLLDAASALPDGSEARSDATEELRASLERTEGLVDRQQFLSRLVPGADESSLDGSAWPETPLDARAGDAHAHALAEGFFKYASYPWVRLGPRIDWNMNPFSDIEWPTSLNRHYHLVSLARAYRETRDGRFLRELLRQLVDWAVRNPVRQWDNWHIAWSTLNAALRLDSWIACLRELRGLNAIKRAEARVWLSIVDENAEFLMHNRARRGNWAVFEANALYSVGVCFPTLVRAGRWREEGKGRLVREMSRQVHADGGHEEHCPGYHQCCVRCFSRALKVSRAFGRDEFPEEFVRSLEKMYEFDLAISMPDGSMPSIGDTCGGSLRPVFEEGARLFDRDDLRKMRDREGRLFVALPETGLFIMRSSWDRDADWLIFDLSPHGGWHSQLEMGQVVVCVRGRAALVDPGVKSYVREAHLESGRTWRHNTVSVPRRDQPRQSPVRVRWEEGDRLTWAGGVFFAAEGVVHARTVAYVGRRAWVIVDELEGTGEAQLNFQFAPGSAVRADEAGFSGAGLAVRVLGKNPALEEGEVYPRYGVTVPAPRVTVAGRAREGRVRFVSLLAPRAKVAELRLAEEGSDGVVVEFDAGGLCGRVRFSRHEDVILPRLEEGR